MILFVDVNYIDNTGFIAAGIVNSIYDKEFIKIYKTTLIDLPEYEAGLFYKRELPCILKILSIVDTNYDAIVIDGFVDLGEDLSPGLGRHLYQEVNKTVIGIAKNYYTGTKEECFVYRNNSKKPLYVSSTSPYNNLINYYVASMHGRFRLPTLVTKIDLHSRNLI